jgi:type I restriction enzyme S subunit
VWISLLLGVVSTIVVVVERFRQSALAAAFSGRLTEDWRNQHDTTQMSIDSLLKTRSKEWEDFQLLRLGARTTTDKPGGAHKKYVGPPPLTIEPNELLPESWIWASLEQVAFVLSGNTPKGIEARLTPRGDVPWFKVGDMNESGNERRMTSVRAFLSREDVANLGMNILPAGTFIFPKRGGAIATNKKRELARRVA